MLRRILQFSTYFQVLLLLFDGPHGQLIDDTPGFARRIYYEILQSSQRAGVRKLLNYLYDEMLMCAAFFHISFIHFFCNLKMIIT